uniref:Uncharacterized protein n=1 Tax=Bubo bubo TaxID=30461 RepID=A0A8C0FEX8_BUBBB
SAADPSVSPSGTSRPINLASGVCLPPTPHLVSVEEGYIVGMLLGFDGFVSLALFSLKLD